MIAVSFDLAEDGLEDKRRALVEELRVLEGQRLLAAGDEKRIAALDREIQAKQSLLESMAPPTVEEDPAEPEVEEEVENSVVERQSEVARLKVSVQRAGINPAWFFSPN